MLKNLFGPLNRDDDELDKEGLEIIYQIVKLEGKDNLTVNFMSSAKARFNNWI